MGCKADKLPPEIRRGPLCFQRQVRGARVRIYGVQLLGKGVSLSNRLQRGILIFQLQVNIRRTLENLRPEIWAELHRNLRPSLTAVLAIEESRSPTISPTEFTRYGADVAIVTAASPSADPVELAATISRDRGRIVVVGTVDLGVSRKAMYMKELSLVLSRSYGPGRYDSEYEEDGRDYPVGYVRWTEKRNMEAFLDLLASGAIQVTPFLERRCTVEQGSAAY